MGGAQGRRGQGGDSTFVTIDCHGPEGGRCTPHTPSLNSFGERKSTHKAAPLPPPWTLLATKPRSGQCEFAYICIPSCAQLHPVLGHKFVAGGSGRAGPTLGGRFLRASRLCLFTPRALAGSHASLSHLPQFAPPSGHLSASASRRPGLKPQIPVLRLSGTRPGQATNSRCSDTSGQGLPGGYSCQD